MLNLLQARHARRRFVEQLRDRLVARAREKVFFQEIAVPDTIDGRFDLVVLHVWMVLERLREAAMEDVAQALTDEIFVSFDDALREQGTGDIGIGKRMKAMASAFHGRLKAYGHADDVAALELALARNIFRGSAGDAAALARYVLSARDALAMCAVEKGGLDFGPLPVVL
jgi:cytochrome b pre-mRNA-processing protein 3